MKKNILISKRILIFCNYIFLLIVALTCLLPFINLFSISLSGSAPVAAGDVKFWPVERTISSYEFVMKSGAFLSSFLISIERVVLGLIVNMILIILTAYPLSKSKENFKKRSLYAWFFIFTMMFQGGLIPWYMVIKMTGLIDTLWALVIPGALPVFSMIVMLNFFRGLPTELEEAAFIDGAGHWKILWEIFVPLSKPSLATVALFSIVGHWNSWFDGLILMNRPEHYPLQSYLQTVIINPAVLFKEMASQADVSTLLSFVNNKTVKAAQLFVAMIPILMAYPFLQKYFTTGLVLGSVKG
jgi:putative aldouronate transport system permease protein